MIYSATLALTLEEGEVEVYVTGVIHAPERTTIETVTLHGEPFPFSGHEARLEALLFEAYKASHYETT